MNRLQECLPAATILPTNEGSFASGSLVPRTSYYISVVRTQFILRPKFSFLPLSITYIHLILEPLQSPLSVSSIHTYTTTNQQQQTCLRITSGLSIMSLLPAGFPSTPQNQEFQRMNIPERDHLRDLGFGHGKEG